MFKGGDSMKGERANTESEHSKFHSAMSPSKMVPTRADVRVGPGTDGDELMRAVLSAHADAGSGRTVSGK